MKNISILLVSFLFSHAQLSAQSPVLEEVYQIYFNLKDALVQTDPKAASAVAKQMALQIPTVQARLSSKETKVGWEKLANSILEDAEHIAESNDISHQRDHFISLSQTVYAAMKISKPVAPVYYQFCPMANKGKGANWVSKEKNIKNPYYGKMMLTCGKVAETLE